MGLIEESLPCYERALQLNPQVSMAWYNRGLTLDRLGQKEEALACTEWQKTRDRNDGLDCRVYLRAAAAAAGMDRYTDVTRKTIEDNIAELAKRVGQPAAPPTNQPKPLMRPVQLPVRSQFFTNDPPPRRW